MPEIKLIITFESNSGQVRVDGPIDDKILSLGLLEIAKQVVLNFKKEDKVGTN